jgi:hypothetical protein
MPLPGAFAWIDPSRLLFSFLAISSNANASVVSLWADNGGSKFIQIGANCTLGDCHRSKRNPPFLDEHVVY